MYETGSPCSACPSGTTCSMRYPGLCTGPPGGGPEAKPKPIEVKPEKPKPKPTGPNPNPTSPMPTPTGAKPTEPTKIVTGSSSGNNNCDYMCKDTGCTVRYTPSQKELYSGSILGSCLPQKWGGRCIGTPKPCSKCLDECPEKNGEGGRGGGGGSKIDFGNSIDFGNGSELHRDFFIGPT
jgi:hypothetical protein